MSERATTREDRKAAARAVLNGFYPHTVINWIDEGDPAFLASHVCKDDLLIWADDFAHHRIECVRQERNRIVAALYACDGDVARHGRFLIDRDHTASIVRDEVTAGSLGR